MSKIVCVVPSIRETQMAEFRKAWAPLFEKHKVTLITVWDGDDPEVEYRRPDGKAVDWADVTHTNVVYRDLLCRRTDAIRNLGFVEATRILNPDYILTLDDDVHPPAGSDPIQEHLDVLQRRVPISWMNTAHEDVIRVIYDEPKNNYITERGKPGPYLRGFPYGIRDEAPVKVSHGVWVSVPDFDGKTQLELTNNGQNPERLPYSLPYFRGPVPRGCYFPFCGMNVMIHRDALPYLYFAPMGPDSGVKGLNRFGDIWLGVILKRQMDSNDWAIYTGASTVIHTRASDPFKNVEQERLGIEWNEWAWKTPRCGETDRSKADSYLAFSSYWSSYLAKAARFRDLIRKLQAGE